MISEISEWVILGVTETDQAFDVPNWPELLCGMMANQTTDNRFEYSDYLKPAHINGHPAVVVLNRMATDNPAAFTVVQKFVAENHLKTRAGRATIRNSEEYRLPEPAQRQFIKG